MVRGDLVRGVEAGDVGVLETADVVIADHVQMRCLFTLEKCVAADAERRVPVNAFNDRLPVRATMARLGWSSEKRCRAAVVNEERRSPSISKMWARAGVFVSEKPTRCWVPGVDGDDGGDSVADQRIVEPVEQRVPAHGEFVGRDDGRQDPQQQGEAAELVERQERGAVKPGGEIVAGDVGEAVVVDRCGHDGGCLGRVCVSPG